MPLFQRNKKKRGAHSIVHVEGSSPVSVRIIHVRSCDRSSNVAPTSNSSSSSSKPLSRRAAYKYEEDENTLVDDSASEVTEDGPLSQLYNIFEDDGETVYTQSSGDTSHSFRTVHYNNQNEEALFCGGERSLWELLKSPYLRRDLCCL